MQSRQRLIRRVGRMLDKLPVSRREIARAAGISHSTVNRIAAGDPRISYETVSAIADALARWGSQLQEAERQIRDVLGELEPEDREK